MYTSPNRLFSIYFLFPCCALKVTCYVSLHNSLSEVAKRNTWLGNAGLGRDRGEGTGLGEARQFHNEDGLAGFPA